MFALVAKHEEGWEQTFLEIVCDTKRYTPELEHSLLFLSSGHRRLIFRIPYFFKRHTAK